MALVSLPCRGCGEKIVVDEAVQLPPEFPFCSKRCRMVDLGKWFDEDYKFSRAAQDRDIETVD
jgi:endogenous inhibitor of DNA gyrase (YacG/DUF329 family)